MIFFLKKKKFRQTRSPLPISELVTHLNLSSWLLEMISSPFTYFFLFVFDFFVSAFFFFNFWLESSPIHEAILKRQCFIKKLGKFAVPAPSFFPPCVFLFSPSAPLPLWHGNRKSIACFSLCQQCRSAQLTAPWRQWWWWRQPRWQRPQWKESSGQTQLRWRWHEGWLQVQNSLQRLQRQRPS